jgi:hypothetical protein
MGPVLSGRDRPGPCAVSVGEQLIEAERRAGRQHERAVALEQPGAGEVAHGPFDRVARSEVLAVAVELAQQLVEADLGRVQGQHALQDGRLDRRVFAGGAANWIPLVHSAYISEPRAGLGPPGGYFLRVLRALPPVLRRGRFVFSSTDWAHSALTAER